MKEQTIITYIKDGKEFTIKHFLKYNFQNEIAKIRKDSISNTTYYKFKNKEYIHIKNFEFDTNSCNYLEITNPNTVVILENCIFNTQMLWIKDLKKIGIDNNNYFQILNPIFKKECEVRVSNIKNVDIVLSNEGENLELNIGNCENVSLTSSPKLKKLDNFKTSKTHIKNLVNEGIKEFYTSSDILLLENSKLENCNLYNKELHLINSTIESKDNLIFIYLKKLILENSHITSSKSILFPYLEEMFFNNEDNETILDTSSYLEASENIAIGTTPYHKQNNNEPIIITKKTLEKDSYLLRNKLLYILKELNNEMLDKQKIKKRVIGNE